MAPRHLFPDIELVWEGKTYKLKHDMKAIRQVERVIFRPEVALDMAQHNVLTPTDQAEIFANLLNLAGCKVDHEEVALKMFSGPGSAEGQLAAQRVIEYVMKPRLEGEAAKPAADAGAADDPIPADRREAS